MTEEALTLNNIAYRSIYDHTAFFMGHLKGKNKREFDMLLTRVKSRVLAIMEMVYVFDESVWSPDQPELYDDLIMFKVKLQNSLSMFTFTMSISKGADQPNVSPLVPDNTVWGPSRTEKGKPYWLVGGRQSGFVLEEGKTYKWSGLSEGLYTIYRWTDEKFRVVKVKKEA